MNTDEMKAVIETAIATDFVLVESADNVHFYATVVAETFNRMTKMQQHKMIMELFQEAIANDSIHALSIKTFTPEKWAKLSANS